MEGIVSGIEVKAKPQMRIDSDKVDSIEDLLLILKAIDNHMPMGIDLSKLSHRVSVIC